MNRDEGLQKSARDYCLRGWLHERFSACDLLQIAYAIWCICDLVSDKNHFLSFFCPKLQMRFCVCTKSHMRYSVSAIWCAIPCTFTTRYCAPNRTANRTANRNTISQHHIVNGSNSVGDTKSQIQQQIGHEIGHKIARVTSPQGDV
jgi:hypothetical protein